MATSFDGDGGAGDGFAVWTVGVVRSRPRQVPKPRPTHWQTRTKRMSWRRCGTSRLRRRPAPAPAPGRRAGSSIEFVTHAEAYDLHDAQRRHRRPLSSGAHRYRPENRRTQQEVGDDGRTRRDSWSPPPPTAALVVVAGILVPTVLVVPVVLVLLILLLVLLVLVLLVLAVVVVAVVVAVVVVAVVARLSTGVAPRSWRSGRSPAGRFR